MEAAFYIVLILIPSDKAFRGAAGELAILSHGMWERAEASGYV